MLVSNSVLKSSTCLNLKTSFYIYSGCWPRMASSKRWNASVTLRSLAMNGAGGAMRTASASTIQKWPERWPLSPGQADRIPGLVASEIRRDKRLSVDCLSLDGEKQCSVILTTSGRWEHWRDHSLVPRALYMCCSCGSDLFSSSLQDCRDMDASSNFI